MFAKAKMVVVPVLYVAAAYLVGATLEKGVKAVIAR